MLNNVFFVFPQIFQHQIKFQCTLLGPVLLLLLGIVQTTYLHLSWPTTVSHLQIRPLPSQMPQPSRCKICVQEPSTLSTLFRCQTMENAVWELKWLHAPVIIFQIVYAVWTWNCIRKERKKCVTVLQCVFKTDLKKEQYKCFVVFIAGPVPPENFKVESVGTTSVSLIWDASGCEENTFHVACSQNGKRFQEEITNSRTVAFSDLSPGKKYSFHITKVLSNGNRSKEAVTYAQTS